MSAQPSIELTFEPSEVTGLKTTGRILGTPQEALTAALHHTRTEMMLEMKQRLDRPGLVTAGTVANIADHSWELIKPSWIRLSVPVIAEAYFKAYRKADAGDISREAVYALANQHAANLGDYYQQTSKTAMVEGFNGYVNRKVAARAAANQVAEAYGLTPRQMRAYIAARMQWSRDISSFTPQGLKREAAKFIVRSLYQRYKTISSQELHNVGEQGKQLAWMYLLEKGEIPAHAEKMWLTAKDEKVCPVCGPLHGIRIPITEKFKTAEGEFWSPGLHPNCRCELRLLPHEFRQVNDVQKDLSGGVLVDFNRKHPRGPGGKFSAVHRALVTTADPDDEFWEIVGEEQRPGGSRVTTAMRAPTAVERTTDEDLKRQFNEVVAATIFPNRATGVGGVVARGPVKAPVIPKAPAKERVQAPAKERVKAPTTRVKAPSTRVKAPTPQRVEAPAPAVTRAPARGKTKPKTETRTSTPVELDKPLFVPVYGKDFDDKNIEMLPQMRLTADYGAAAGRAEDMVRALVRNKVRSITRVKQKRTEIAGIQLESAYEPRKHIGPIRPRITTQGGPQYWDMTEDQVTELVEWVAQQAVANNLSKDYYHTKDKGVPIFAPEEPQFTNVWTDSDGKPIPGKRPSTFYAGELARKMGLRASDFDVRVVQIDRAVQDPKDLSEDVKEHLPEGPWVSGPYKMVPGSVQPTDESTMRATHMKIVPVSEDEEWKKKRD